MAKSRTKHFRATTRKMMDYLEEHFWKKFQQLQPQSEAAKRNPVAGQIVKRKEE
jgi:hypothetical protein